MTNAKIMTGVIGYPIEHSLSAVMHNAAYQALDLNYEYVVHTVEPKDLRHAIIHIKELGFRGVNITIPHKVSVLGMLDDIHDSVRGIGAVNTILNDNGRLIGFNTDGEGYIRSLTEELNVSIS